MPRDDPSALYKDASKELLLEFVKHAGNHGFRGSKGEWAEYTKAIGTGAPPNKRTREELEGFVASIFEEGDDDAASDGDGREETDNAQEGPNDAKSEDGKPESGGKAKRHHSWAESRELARSYLKWLKTIHKEKAKGLGILPPVGPPASDAKQQQESQPQQPESQPEEPQQESPQQPQQKKPQQQQQQKQPQQAQQELQTGQVSVWSLVHKTQQHPKYVSSFKMASYRPDWVRTKRRLLDASQVPQLLALDCEMCATEDDPSALLGVCVVDEWGRVLYRQLVRPPGTITDLRTNLTGVTEADLANVTLTAKDAQRAVRRLLEGRGLEGLPGAEAAAASSSPAAQPHDRPVVLVGHALQHDLLALRIDHEPVIDTAMLYSYRILTCVPGLKDLAKQLLGLDMRSGAGGVHDSMEDAAVAMRLVMRELQMARLTSQLEPPQVKVPLEEQSKLFVHGLPSGTTEMAVRALFSKRGDLLRIEGDVKERKVHAVFKSSYHANENFKDLPGQPQKDSTGRFFKEVPLGTTGAMCKVRKMAAHDGWSFYVSTAIPRSLRVRQPHPQGSGRPGGIRGGMGARGPQPGSRGGARPAAARELKKDGEAGGDGERQAKRQKRGHEGDPVKVAGTGAKEGGAAAAAGASAAAGGAAAAPKVKVEKAGGQAQKEEGQPKAQAAAVDGTAAGPAAAATVPVPAKEAKEKKDKKREKKEKAEKEGKEEPSKGTKRGREEGAGGGEGGVEASGDAEGRKEAKRAKKEKAKKREREEGQEAGGRAEVVEHGEGSTKKAKKVKKAE
ncbi:hypothetical protein Agub_g10021 [Astrephomene gubernaculifera]|uniref:Exonuclease domain-containing protein n=1 Tax=Astrephomene gubernaculifera TaxID=47775 RepID=A0AAD3DX01_9CHLO|nr:hypothetical protein Agub_g10021 [Astrephomene gubernaculifera]